MKTVSQHISSKEFEVSLAISTQPTLRDDLEDHFFGHGLEYIDGASPFTHNSAAESDGSVGKCGRALTGRLDVILINYYLAPGIHRALDALSTIMWPSMVRSMTKPSHTSRSQSLDDSDLALQALIADAGASSDELSTSRASRLQKEMDELERWLEDGDYDSENDPWKTSALSSKDMKKEDLKSGKGVSDGFDDDFADFVSAPSLSLVPSDPLNPSATDDTHPFAPLGDDEDDSDGLPSRADIETTASRIFHQTSDRSGEPNQDIDDDDERDAPAFDLSRILSALQGMKEEIAGIEDEAERRKAAAKVALGLVYGLEGFSEGDEETDTGRSKGIA